MHERIVMQIYEHFIIIFCTVLLIFFIALVIYTVSSLLLQFSTKELVNVGLFEFTFGCMVHDTIKL